MQTWAIILVALLATLIVLFIVSAFLWAYHVPTSKDALFRIKNLSINHQGATSIDVIVHNVYTRNARWEKLAKQADITKVVQGVLDSPTFTNAHPWESVAEDVGDQLYNDYDVAGVSVEILVPSGSNVSTATYTKGYATKVLRLDASNTSE